MVNFEVASPSSFRDIQKKNHFFPASAEAAAADIDDSIMRNAYADVSHKYLSPLSFCSIALEVMARLSRPRTMVC